MNNKIDKEKIEKYFKITKKALEIVKKNILKEEEAKQIIEMASNYISDADHFFKENDWVNAFAALNYAHGWIDSGARLKIFNVSDSKLFTIP